MCIVCGYEAKPTDSGYLEHTCSFDTEWSQNGTSHWHICVDENCYMTEDSGEHDFVDGICSVCGFDLASGLELTLSEDGSYYSVTNRNPDVTGWDVFIPPIYKGIPITHIVLVGDLTSISIPDSIVYIEDRAINPFVTNRSGELKYLGNEEHPYIYLYGNVSRDIETAKIENGCKIINGGVFERCSNLKSVTIPNGVTSIGYSAFSGCSSLTSIVLPDSVVYVGADAFYECVNLQDVTLSKGLKTISARMFWRCKALTEISLEYATTIYYDVFSDCENLEKVCLSDDITYVAGGLLNHCGKIKYNEKDGNKYLGSKTNKYLYLADADRTIKSTVSIENGCKYIGSHAFSSCKMKEVKIPKTVKAIGIRAFNYCTRLENITIPDSVTFIDEYAFYSSSIQSIEIPSGVTSISGSTFSDCWKLKEVKLPNTIKSIGSFAFSGCRDLESINIPSGITTISGGVFGGCENLEEVKLPETLTSIGLTAFSGCKNLKRINIPNGVTSFGDEIFYNCDSLICNEKDGLKYLGNDDNKYLYLLGSISKDIESVNIDSGCKCIGDDAFKECKNITTVVIPNNIVKIGSYAFYNCEKLESIAIPDNVISLNEYAFYGCKALSNVTLGRGITEIARYAFADCCDLTVVTIQAGLTDIERYAFRDCIALTAINFNGTMAQWYDISKEDYIWDSGVGEYTVVCTDGSISKVGA